VGIITGSIEVATRRKRLVARDNNNNNNNNNNNAFKDLGLVVHSGLSKQSKHLNPTITTQKD
jgi:hypothetical protein